METETRMVQLAERQTKALESINKILTILFALFVLGAVIWLIGLLNDAGVIA